MPWPLLERYPELAMLNPSALCTLPTPVEPLPGLGANCWVKRDDISARPYGGNKLRKLEWILPDIRREDAHTVVTLGATGTNAGLATSCSPERRTAMRHLHLPATGLTSGQAKPPGHATGRRQTA